MLTYFQSSYRADQDTLRKTKSLFLAYYYLPRSATPYPSQYIGRLLKTREDNVLVKAAGAFKTGAHKRQWGTLDSQPLFEAELWAKNCHITTLNV